MPARTYYERCGAIWQTGERRVSLASAVSLRAAYLADMADIEARFGTTDPEAADIMLARNLRCARELREAITAVRAFDPEPPVAMGLSAIEQVAA